MRKAIGILIIAAVSLLAVAPAFGAASASVTVNGTTRTLSETGFLFEQIGLTPANLVPGQSANYSFNYSVSVQDSGLPVAFDPKSVGCSSIFPTTCGDAYTGFEYAKAYLIVLAEDPRVSHNPAIITQGLRGSVTLATHGDSFAELLAQSGTLTGHIEVADVPGANAFFNLYPTYVALWVLASPIPEPETYALMLAGFAAMGWVFRFKKAG